MSEHGLTVETWLRDICHCTDIQPVKVAIGKRQVFHGCRYIDPKHPGARPVIYLVGRRPKHRRKTCYTVDGQTWYVVAYIDNVSAQFKEHHPFGENFILGRWMSSSPIDQGERSQYDRIEIVITEV